MQIFCTPNVTSSLQNSVPTLLNEASVIEIADIWLSASIPSDHSCDYMKLLFLWKNGRRKRSARRAEKGVRPLEWTEIFSNYVPFFVQSIDAIGFCHHGSLSRYGGASEMTIDDLCNSNFKAALMLGMR